MYDDQRDAHAIDPDSFAILRRATDLSRMPAALEPLAVRFAHAGGRPDALDNRGPSPAAGAAAAAVNAAAINATGQDR